MDFLTAVKVEAEIRKLVRAANDQRVVAFPLRRRKPWRKTGTVGELCRDCPRPAA